VCALGGWLNWPHLAQLSQPPSTHTHTPIIGKYTWEECTSAELTQNGSIHERCCDSPAQRTVSGHGRQSPPACAFSPNPADTELYSCVGKNVPAPISSNLFFFRIDFMWWNVFSSVLNNYWRAPFSSPLTWICCVSMDTLFCSATCCPGLLWWPGERDEGEEGEEEEEEEIPRGGDRAPSASFRRNTCLDKSVICTRGEKSSHLLNCTWFLP